jgi:3-oxoacyl-[acyl-carrier-protein] synthase II
MNRRVVVTGIGLVTPLNPFEGYSEFWKSLCEGKDAVRSMPSPMLKNEKEWKMAAIDMPAHLLPEDKICYLASKALGMALEDAAIADSSKAGLCLGTVLGNILLKEKRFLTEKEPAGINISDKERLTCLGSYLATEYNLGGTCLTISTACASGTDAIGAAARKIAEGSADIIIAGGADILSDFALFGFNALQALTHEKVRPFDKNRTGLALGEGAAFLVLESEQRAIKRGASIEVRCAPFDSTA